MLPGRVVRGRQNPLHWKFPERLKRARKAAGLTSQALSLAAKMGKGGEALLESAHGVPRLLTVERLADLLRVSPAYLAFGLDVPWEAADAPRSAGVAERARAARELRGFSQREVDRRTEDAAGTIRAVESGTMPTLKTIEKIARALAVSPAWLAFGIGPRELPRRGTRAAGREAGIPPVPAT